ncbi:uncharacterized protein E0L32_003988 [Thyridium curvatum]|uniref:Zn(2)-C6 fungal-type domain-containing protein n=1 Tax=Thyridium curvatum TaxID=1093900 RepID=A0A507BGA1_9PEZI|nr:uncharacterized protein E0L32_003988 [Thyridium curvatum]TPX16339.1 hypothetical protein E0L32_003988 [Thyridium curvatum]
MTESIGADSPGSTHDHDDNASDHEPGPIPSTASVNQLVQSLPRGASVYTPNTVPSGDMNPRSCVTCRRRKVRCDKTMPCANCRRAQIPCVFPPPERAPRRPRRRDPNAAAGGSKAQSSEREVELLKRLRKLEGIVEELSGQIEVETSRHQSSSGNSPEAMYGFGEAGSATAVADRTMGSVSGGSNRSHDSPRPGQEGNSPSGPPNSGIFTTGYNPTFPPPKRTSTGEVRKKFGRLVINDAGRTRYVSSAFWSKINDELDELRASAELGLTSDDTEQSEAGSDVDEPADNSSQAVHHAFLFGYRSSDLDLKKYHPLPSQAAYMWQIYQENVDPLVKVLHIPTMDKLVRASRNPESLVPQTEALMFAMYFGALTSMDDEDVMKNFNADRTKLLAQHRFALEQALARAQFLTSSDLTTLQAFVLYLAFVRRNDDARAAWTLTGLGIRIAQSMGLQRDGTNFDNLTPFEIEMRRRLWWAICMIDLRSAEDQGTDLTILESTHDTRIPLNINDKDISPESKELPPERSGSTDTTFTVIRCEICQVGRRLHTATAAGSNEQCPEEALKSLELRESVLRGVYERIENQYFRDSSRETNPFFWIAANVARVIIAKLVLVLYQPFLFRGPGNEDLSSDVRDRLFAAATEIFECNHLLNNDPRTKQYRWIFQTYTQWHAVAYVMMEVAHREWSSSVERAWAALNAAFLAPNSTLDIEKMAEHSAIWLPFKKLYAKARRHRETEIARLKASPQAAVELDREDRVKAKPESMDAIRGGMKALAARQRWRVLVGDPPLDKIGVPPPHLQKKWQEEQEAEVKTKAESDSGKSAASTAKPAAPSPWAESPAAGLPASRPSPSGNQDVAGAREAQGQSMEQNMHTRAVYSFMDSIMSQPAFEPHEWIPMLYSSNLGDDVQQMSDFRNFPNVPQQQHQQAGNSNDNNSDTTAMSGLTPTGSSGTSMSGNTPSTTRATTWPIDMPTTSVPPQQQQQQQQQQQAPVVNKNDLPPWLWPSAPYFDNSPYAAAGLAAGDPAAAAYLPGVVVPGASGLGTDANTVLPTTLSGEDVNMDDNFDWQNFGENIRGFELETNGGMSGSVWASHV